MQELLRDGIVPLFRHERGFGHAHTAAVFAKKVRVVGERVNPEKAQAYFEKLANKDSSYCFKISEFYGDGKDGFPRDDIKAAEWYARGAQNGDVSTHIFAVFKYWKIRDIPNAVKWCNKIISDSQKNLAAIGSQASDAKNVQADMIRQTLKIAKTMLSDISSGSPAPADINAYYNSILSQK